MAPSVLIALTFLAFLGSGRAWAPVAPRRAAKTGLRASSQESPSASGRWQPGRFLRTAFFFNAPRLRGGAGQKNVVLPGEVAWDASSAAEWGVLDDVVMGGVSASQWRLEDGVGVWVGDVSTDNNGGFCGARTRLLDPPLDFSRARGVVLRLKGNGQRYKFILRDDADWNGTSWTFSFDTQAGRWIDVKVPFGALIPTKFARTLKGVAPFDNSKVTTFQLTYSKFEYDGGLNPKFRTGPFQLELEKITAF
uniref:NADH:ubiquinone oxidoreductase intermediate-associated protein 30 domain-containing protein n=1 Tax=Pinguiococcus pyrenoidosus TaxID=172671 RepID=A0A7R9U7U7_9STRA